jgi:hypothetical protein
MRFFKMMLSHTPWKQGHGRMLSGTDKHLSRWLNSASGSEPK